MELNIIVDDYSMNLNIPNDFATRAGDSLARLDASMEGGIQLGRDWIEHPDAHQRCQLAADKLLTALETDNEQLALLSAAYIVEHMPGITRVIVDTSGEMRGTRFEGNGATTTNS